MMGWVIGGGAALLAYVNRAKITQWLQNKGLHVHVPGVPANVPPSWAYQGPPAPQAPPTGHQQSVIIVGGGMTVTPQRGDELIASLADGASWQQSGTNVPTSIGGTVASDWTTGPNAPLVIDGVNGAGVILLNWTDATGAAQQTMLTVTAS